MSKKRIAFLPNHPAQIWLLRPIAEGAAEFADVVWIIRDKDCALELADALGLGHTVLTKAARGFVGNALEFARATAHAVRLGVRLKIDLWVTKHGPGNIAARLTGKESVSFNDDDADVVPLIAWTSYPFASATLVTDVTRMGRFEPKAIRFKGFYELCYLHPDRFTPDESIFEDLGVPRREPYALVRLSALQAHHDVGIRGVSEDLLRSVIALTEDRMQLFITSEKPLAADLESYRLPLALHRVHHALAFAQFYLGDSQTMTSEAAVLGTPAFRINDFVGRISYIEELEKRGLAFGFRPGQEADLLRNLKGILQMENMEAEFQKRRQDMLSEKIDPVPWFVDILRMMVQGVSMKEIRERVSGAGD